MPVLPYNLIRTIMGQAASQIGIEPRAVSFKATIQILEASQPLIAHHCHLGALHRQELYQQLLDAIATHRVAYRPDRFEPRMMKRTPKNYGRLTRPRREIKREIIERFSDNKVPFVDQTEARTQVRKPDTPSRQAKVRLEFLTWTDAPAGSASVLF
jgi:hypothetical protein